MAETGKPYMLVSSAGDIAGKFVITELGDRQSYFDKRKLQ